MSAPSDRRPSGPEADPVTRSVEGEASSRPPADHTRAQTLIGDSGGDDVAGGLPRFGPGEELAGRYRIISSLGRGGMGDVYRAEDLKRV